jgi:hypothetical protein
MTQVEEVAAIVPEQRSEAETASQGHRQSNELHILREGMEVQRMKTENAESEATTARRDAETARRDAEAARRELAAARHEAETANFETKTARNETETARREAEMARNEMQTARRELNRAWQEIRRLSDENDRLQRRLHTAEAARGEKEQQLNEYLNALVIDSNDLSLDCTQLGSGSFGGVRAGYWRGIRVAVKKFHEAIMSPHLEPLCRRELSVCSQLHHPHVVQMYGAVIVNGTPLQLVMELMQGSIRDLIDAAHASSCYLSYREQIDIATGTIAGIVYMHQLQPNPYVHCDIRSTNVMVTRDMVAKVGDLGASHVIDSSLSLGPLSIEYVAPERMPRPDGTSAQSTCESDIYSLGVYLIELFTGEIPIPEERNSQLERIKSDVLVDVCSLMVSLDPSERPSAKDCFIVMERRKETGDYKVLPGRRLVKGHQDREQMSLTDFYVGN